MEKKIINQIIAIFRKANELNCDVEQWKNFLRADANGNQMKYIGTSAIIEVKRPGKARKVLNIAVANKDTELVNRLVAAGYITVDWKRWEKENPKDFEEVMSREGYATEKPATAAAVSIIDLLHE